MQYETVILEMLSRIKALEAEVAALKSAVFEPEEAEAENAAPASDGRTREPYQKITDEMIDACYHYAKELTPETNPKEQAAEIAAIYGMKKSTAIIYLYAIQALLNGTVIKRAVSTRAARRYFDLILRDFGTTGLKKALEATRLQIEYRSQCELNSDSIKALLEEYTARLS